jgi:hypothetical protein
VSFEDRQDLLGHKSQRITTHYSAPDIDRLLLAAEKVVNMRQEPSLRLVNRQESPNSHTEQSISAAQSVRTIDSVVEKGDLEVPTTAATKP